MKADYVERNDIRAILGVIDRIDYNENNIQNVLRKTAQSLTRDSITTLINYVIDLENRAQWFNTLEAAVLHHPEAKIIFENCIFPEKRIVSKNGELASGPDLDKEVLKQRRREL